MPLVLITGYPASGKTRRALQLRDFFLQRIEAASDPRINQFSVHVVNSETLGLSREVYQSAKSEKDARAAEYSAVKRLLGPGAVVILDGLNYIKGFRYQLYCESKAVETPSCVVHVGTPIPTCRQINLLRRHAKSSEEPYADEVFENLVYRYEEPNGMNRWDSPLFTVLYEDECPPYEQIWDSIIGPHAKAKHVRPNQATVLKPASEENYLYELDKSTSEILNTIFSWQKDHPGEGGEDLAIFDLATRIRLPPTPVPFPQLQRIRRQFISLNRDHPLSRNRIGELFVDYINSNLQQ